MNLPLIIAPILALAAGCLAAAQSGLTRLRTGWAPSCSLLELATGDCLEGGWSGPWLFPFNLSLSERTNFSAFCWLFSAETLADNFGEAGGFWTGPDLSEVFSWFVLNPSEDIRRENSFEARSTTLLVDVLMLMSKLEFLEHHDAAETAD